MGGAGNAGTSHAEGTVVIREYPSPILFGGTTTALVPGAVAALTLFAPEDDPAGALPLPGVAQGRVRWVLVP